MSLIDLYLELPRYPRFVAIDTEFKGANEVFKGIKNPSIDISKLKLGVDYEVVDGINLLRAKVKLLRYQAPDPSTGLLIPEKTYGYFWVYKTGLYGDFSYMNGRELNYYRDSSSTSPDERLISNWDVLKHYISLPENNYVNYEYTIDFAVLSYYPLSVTEYNPTARIVLVNQQNGSGYPDGLGIEFKDGRWLWDDWLYWHISSDDGTNEKINYNISYQSLTIPTVINFKARPTYIDLLSGYPLDSRMIESNPIIIPTVTESVSIAYYRENKLEPIPNLRSIDWLSYDINLVAEVPFTLPIVDCVLGTLNISSDILKTDLLSSTEVAGAYPHRYYFNENLPALFIEWNKILKLSSLSTNILRVLGANNNYWSNKPTPTPDQNYDLEHPMFIIDNVRAYNWHIKTQADGSYGDLVMDSTRGIESHEFLVKLLRALQIDNYQVENLTSTPPLHYLDWYIKNSSGDKLDKVYKALGADIWGTNPDNPDVPRVANLGHLISKIASLLGYRPEPDGTFKPEKEKALVRQIVNNKQQIDHTKIGVNNFAALGMILRRLNNRFNGKNIVADECVVVRDIPQILAEYQDQLNLALGLQESSAIEIKSSDSTARYGNQLAVMVELLNLAKSNNDSIRAALVSSLVAQAQSSEIIAALGLPTVTKSLPVKIDNKIDHLPYKGVSAHRSISQEIAVCTANVGIVLGQVL